MGHQIMKQPNNKYAIYSSITETLIGWNIDKESLIEYYKEEASKRAEKETLSILTKIENNEKPYYQFTKTWDEVKDSMSDE